MKRRERIELLDVSINTEEGRRRKLKNEQPTGPGKANHRIQKLVEEGGGGRWGGGRRMDVVTMNGIPNKCV